MTSDPTGNSGFDDSFAVDVVIPVRNGARFIGACLNSVKAQTLLARAVIVTDDGSTDETPAILARFCEEWPLLQVIRSAPKGVSHARNLAIAACRAPYVAFIDSDDLWEPDKLEKQIALLQARAPECGFVHCSYRNIDNEGRLIETPPVMPPSKRGDLFIDLVHGYTLSGSASAVVTRLDLLRSIGGFDERLFYGEDWDVWIKLARRTQIDFVPEALSLIRVDPRSSQRRGARAKAEAFLFQRLRIIDNWIEALDDRDAMLDDLRKSAAGVALLNMLRLRPKPGLLRRLQESDIALARRLFEGRRQLLNYVLQAVANRLRTIVAQHVVLRSRLLLRVFQTLGKFKGVQP